MNIRQRIHMHNRTRFFFQPFSVCFLVLLVVASLARGIFVYAEPMQSTNYKIQSDSVNIEGARSSSASYIIEDTGGEVGTGDSSSASYAMKAGFQAMQVVYLALSVASDVVMSPNIGGVSGGTANGSTAVTVTTDNSAGYELSITASTSPALKSGAYSFADYVPSGANPDFTFSISAADSEFGFTPEGTDITQKYKDNGSGCNTGSSDAADSCWGGLSTTPQVIASRTSGNHPSGTSLTVKFRAQSGASHLQVEGVYVATTTLTLLPL